jgi:molybdopterin-guanine dinucleotide biosynthesis protein A
VLAGGASRRMGEDKHELKLPDGRTMLEVATDVLGEVCARVVVVGDFETSVQRVTDLRPDQGPLGGIEAILASGLDTQYLVCPCDMPLVTPALLQRLTGPSQAGATVFRVDGEDAPRPLPVRIAASLADTVATMLDAQQRAVHRLIGAVGTDVVTLGAAESGALVNVNTVEEYDAVTRAWPRS